LLLDLFLIGLVVTLEPIPLTAMILLLATEGGLMKGLGYVLGWMLTLVAIVALVVLVTGGKPLIPNSNPSTAELAVRGGRANNAFKPANVLSEGLALSRGKRYSFFVRS